MRLVLLQWTAETWDFPTITDSSTGQHHNTFNFLNLRGSGREEAAEGF